VAETYTLGNQRKGIMTSKAPSCRFKTYLPYHLKILLKKFILPKKMIPSENMDAYSDTGAQSRRAKIGTTGRRYLPNVVVWWRRELHE